MTLVRYVGDRDDGFNVVGGWSGRLYEVKGPGDLVDVAPGDLGSFQREFFREVPPLDPLDKASVKACVAPLRGPVTIDPADGISDAEAVLAESALVQYVTERMGRKLARIMAVNSADPEDYMEAASDG